MGISEAIQLLDNAGETTREAWQLYQVIVLAILGFVVTNRAILDNKNLKLSVIAAFIVFAVYSGFSMKKYQERKIAAWNYSLEIAKSDGSKAKEETIKYIHELKPTSVSEKVLVQILFNVIVVFAIYIIPNIRKVASQ